jgi:hypothetical protein
MTACKGDVHGLSTFVSVPLLYHADERWFGRFILHAALDHGAYGCRQRHQLKLTS